MLLLAIFLVLFFTVVPLFFTTFFPITGETTTVTKAPAPPPPGSRLVGGVSSVSSEGDLADRPGRRRESKVRFGAGGEGRGSNPKSMKRAWSSFIGI